MSEDLVYRGIPIASDERVTPLIGYCPYCPIAEDVWFGLAEDRPLICPTSTFAVAETTPQP